MVLILALKVEHGCKEREGGREGERERERGREREREREKERERGSLYTATETLDDIPLCPLLKNHLLNMFTSLDPCDTPYKTVQHVHG